MKSLKDYILNEGFKLGKNKVKKEDDFVDLGLPSGTLWCKYNVGAKPGSTPESWYGDYFMWGDTKVPDNNTYNWGNYKYSNGGPDKLTKYCSIDKTDCWDGKGKPDNKLVLDKEDDIATVNMKGNWKMPTQEQLKELLDNTTYEWIRNYNDISGLNGRLFTSKKNDNTLFIPAAGRRYSNIIQYDGSRIYIWSSTLYDDNPSWAHYLYSRSYTTSTDEYLRYLGCSVRAVAN